MLDRQKVLDEAQAKIDLAYDTTPPEYHGFITVIKGNPYMKVDGRVAMARDEHRELGKRLDIMKATFDTVFDTPMCQVTVYSEIFGMATGTSKVFIGGRGVDQTNPLENAETSAVGRALGFMGYGLLGGGIASAEEVEQAIQEQAPATKSTKVAEADPYDLGGNGNIIKVKEVPEAPSDKQIQFLRALLSQNGTLKGDSVPVVHAVYEHEPMSKARVSADIEELRDAGKLPPKYMAAYLKILREKAKLSHEDVYGYIKKYFNAVKIKDLTREQQDQLIGWLTIGNEDADGWNSMLQNVATATRFHTETVQEWIKYVFPTQTSEEILARVNNMTDSDLRQDILSYQVAMERQLTLDDPHGVTKEG